MSSLGTTYLLATAVAIGLSAPTLAQTNKMTRSRRRRRADCGCAASRFDCCEQFQ